MKVGLTKRADGLIVGIDMSQGDTVLIRVRPTHVFDECDIVNLFNDNYYYHGVFAQGLAIYSKDNNYYYLDCDDWDNNDNYVLADAAYVEGRVYNVGDVVHYDDDNGILHYIDCTVCDNCGEYIPDDVIIRDNYGNNICPDCCDSDYIRCENCECLVRFDESCYCERDDCSYCEDCYNSECNVCNNLHNYCYKPDSIFFGGGDKFFGIELECSFDDNYDAVEYIHNNYNFLYCKEDSSVDGIEIVSHPMSYDFIKNNYVKAIEKVTDDYNGRGHNIGGMHVHINRGQFIDDEHFSKFYDLFNADIKFLEIIAQRSISDWGKINSYDGTKKLTDQVNYNGVGRYSAINLQNRETIEIRIFNSNLRPDRILKNILFIIAMIDYTKIFDNCNLEGYIRYVNSRRLSFPELYEFLIEKEVI